MLIAVRLKDFTRPAKVAERLQMLQGALERATALKISVPRLTPRLQAACKPIVPGQLSRINSEECRCRTIGGPQWNLAAYPKNRNRSP